jgi:hypothetical protein
MKRYWLYLGSAVATGAIAAACGNANSSGGGTGNLFGQGGTGGTAGSVAAGAQPGTGGTRGLLDIDAGQGGSGNTGGGNVDCTSGADEDKDQDGFTKTAGDCNDCDANVNPGAIDVYKDGADGGVAEWGDEDCDGTPGSSGMACDDGILLDDLDPMNAAKSIELCKTTGATDNTYGVISAQWVRADGTPFATPGLQVGIQPDFGPNVNVQGGKRMLSMSSGYARTPSQPGACGTSTCMSNYGGFPPPGFPQDSPSCIGGSNINDDVALELKIRAPTNATGYSFNFKFYSFEFEEWVCTTYNDQFIALISPAPTGAINGNICFDSQSNPVSVNIGYFDVCDPLLTGEPCAQGPAELLGTGFDVWEDSGATLWLETTAPIAGGEEFTIRLAIWDTGDQALDSTALIDNFRWLATGGTVTVGTKPIPVPK